MSSLKNTLVNDTGYIQLPVGTTAQRPGSPQLGYMRFNTDNNAIEAYMSVGGSGGWDNVLKGPGDGSTSGKAATSAQDIKTITGTTTSAYYWILIGSTPTQVYCDMTGATAWMLAMHVSKTSHATFGYNSAYWTDSSDLNPTGDPLTDINIKNGVVWTGYTVSNIRLTGSATVNAYTSNPLTFTGFGATLQTIFSSAANSYDSNVNIGRTAWINWSNAVSGTSTSQWDNQPNCNRDGINVNGVYHFARIGITFNNEADCATNDSGVGFGMYYQGIDTGAGGQTWSATTAYPCHGWLWVN